MRLVVESIFPLLLVFAFIRSHGIERDPHILVVIHGGYESRRIIFVLTYPHTEQVCVVAGWKNTSVYGRTRRGDSIRHDARREIEPYDLRLRSRLLHCWLFGAPVIRFNDARVRQLVILTEEA